MSSALNSGSSPSGNPAAGVRRLNKLPLVILTVLGVVVAGLLGYAAYERSLKSRMQGDEGLKEQSTDAGLSGVLPVEAGDAPAFIEADIPMPEAAEIRAALPVPLEDDMPPVPALPLPDVIDEPVPLTEEEKAALAREAQGRQYRENGFMQAVVAKTGVSGGTNSGGATAGTGVASRPAIGLPDNLEDERQRRIAAVMAQIQQRQTGGDGLTGAGNGSTAKSSAASLLAALGGSSAAGGGTSTSSGDDPNLQERKEDFLKTERKYGYSDQLRKAQLTDSELRVGTLIPAVMISGINSDLPGELLAQVSQDVRDTRSGRQVLIPQGSKLIGSYDNRVADGQDRVLIAWYRLQFPDGSVLELGSMSGSDQGGYAGLHDQVDEHTVDTFKNATLLSLLGAGAQLSQSDGDEAAQQLAAELGRQWSEVGTEMVKRKMDRQPTLKIRSGYRFNVFINKDLILPPYQAVPALSEQ